MNTAQLATVRILWGSLCGSHLLLAGVGLFFLGAPVEIGSLELLRAAPPLPPADEASAVWLASFFVLASSFAVPRLLTSPPKASATPTEVFTRAYTPFILSMALAEACSLCGLLAGRFLGGSRPELMLVPMAAGFIVAVSRFPSEARLRQLARVEP